MFQLEEAVHTWKVELRSGDAMTCGDVDELEQHVRDGVSDIVSRGLSEEEAFLIAIHRIGPPASLRAEFLKNNEGRVWTQRAFWMVCGYLLFEVVRTWVAALEWVSVSGAIWGGWSAAAGALISTSVAALFWTTLGIRFWKRSCT